MLLFFIWKSIAQNSTCAEIFLFPVCLVWKIQYMFQSPSVQREYYLGLIFITSYVWPHIPMIEVRPRSMWAHCNIPNTHSDGGSTSFEGKVDNFS